MRHSVLLIDDDSEMSVMLTELFKRESVDLTTAEDGVDGLKTAKQHAESLDLIVLDIQMPKADGITLLRYVRNFNQAGRGTRPRRNRARAGPRIPQVR